MPRNITNPSLDLRTYVQPLQNHGPAWRAARERQRVEALGSMQREINERLACEFADRFPHFHQMHLLHPSASEARDLARTSHQVRKLGWRGAQWMAAITGLDLTDERQAGWVVAWRNYPQFLRFDEAWEGPFRVPSGIPITPPSDELHEQWQPDTSIWDVEDAAWHELELGMGGPATVELTHDLAVAHYNVPHRSSDLFSRLQKWTQSATRVRVAMYLDYWQRIDYNDGTLPDDPYDPLHWGHDTRIRTLLVRTADQTPIELTPAFDPEVLEYTTAVSLDGAEVLLAYFDPLLSNDSVTKDMTASLITLTVKANNGLTKRVYTVRLEGT